MSTLDRNPEIMAERSASTVEAYNEAVRELERSTLRDSKKCGEVNSERYREVSKRYDKANLTVVALGKIRDELIRGGVDEERLDVYGERK